MQNVSYANPLLMDSIGVSLNVNALLSLSIKILGSFNLLLCFLHPISSLIKKCVLWSLENRLVLQTNITNVIMGRVLKDI